MELAPNMEMRTKHPQKYPHALNTYQKLQSHNRNQMITRKPINGH